jgi:hypothetical protein
MKVVFKKTKEEYISFFSFFSFRRKRAPRFILILAFALTSGLGADAHSLLSYSYRVSLTLLILLAVGFLFPYLILRIRLFKALRTRPEILESTSFEITESGILIKSDSITGEWNWKTVKKFEHDGGYIFIKSTNKKQVIFIPDSAFQSVQEADLFFETMLQYYKLATGFQRIKSGKHLYYFGLLGILPNIGLISGFVLLYKGLFTYEDRKLAWIGGAGVLFTIAFWIILSNLVFSETWNLKAKGDYTRCNMNSLVKEIEFFNLQNGTYPDSLSQLRRGGEFLILQDSFNKANKNGEGFFCYRKIRNKYTLYSVGEDGKPNTGDDIYPDITKGDTVRLGLIRDELMKGK